MGASVSQNVNVKPPLTIGEFRNIGTDNQYLIPEVPEKRQVTDFKFTITFAVCIGLLVPFLIYTFVYSDTDRLIPGYDECGNICGKKNPFVDGISCSGADKTDTPYLQVRKKTDEYLYESYLITDKKCVKECEPGTQLVDGGCYDSSEVVAEMDFLKDIGDGLSESAGHVVAICFIGFALSVGMILLFRYFVAVVVWTILIGSLIGLVILTIFAWHANSNVQSGSSNGLQYLAIFLTIFSIVVFLMLICMFKRIKLVIRLFKEAIRVVCGIPMILFEPLLTLAASTVLLLIFLVFLFIMASAGILQSVGDVYEYEPNAVMAFTVWFHVIICLWMMQFIVGCQHMVISGAVSTYYFARDKKALGSPIYNGFYNLIRYHLGTVAFGSFILTVVAIIKGMIRGLANNNQTRILINCCLGAIEDFLKYLSKNAYIQTAIHGQPFYKSGKRAVRLLAANALSTIAVNSVGDFVLAMAKLLIILFTTLIAVWMQASYQFHVAVVVVGVFVTAVIADCFFIVFETAIDTIFMCFCEDSCMNDGVERPYYMSVNLMQYIEESKAMSKDHRGEILTNT